MFPGMNFPKPDPEKILQTMENLKAIFEEAAAADTGNAQPHFQKLSDAFNKIVTDGQSLQNQNPADALRQMAPVLMQLQTTMTQLQREASRDPVVAETLQTLMAGLQNEMMQLMPGLPGLSGNAKPPAPPKPPKPPAAPRPKKPGNGSFDL